MADAPLPDVTVVIPVHNEADYLPTALPLLFDEMAKADREAGDSEMSAYTDHMADQGTEAMEREKAALFATKEGRYLYRLEEALRRLWNSPETFGSCHTCGAEVGFERLDALPHARYCIECKLKEEGEAA